MSHSNSQRGFTLIEIAIVMVIVGLLLGGLLGPLSVQHEQRKRAENETRLNQAQEALLGFAAVNNRLPCPDTDGDRLENAPCWVTAADPRTEFYVDDLPTATLGLQPFDAWDSDPFRYTVNGAFTIDPIANPGQGFTLQTQGVGAGVLRVFDPDTGGSCAAPNLANNVPAVIVSTAKLAYANAIEQQNLNNDNCFARRNYNLVVGNEFDDQLVWLSANILFNKMLAAGALP